MIEQISKPTPYAPGTVVKSKHNIGIEEYEVLVLGKAKWIKDTKQLYGDWEEEVNDMLPDFYYECEGYSDKNSAINFLDNSDSSGWILHKQIKKVLGKVDSKNKNYKDTFGYWPN